MLFSLSYLSKAVKRRVRSEVRQSEFRTVKAEHGEHCRTWSWSFAPNTLYNSMQGCGGKVLPLSGTMGITIPAEASFREEGVKQGGNTEGTSSVLAVAKSGHCRNGGFFVPCSLPSHVNNIFIYVRREYTNGQETLLYLDGHRLHLGEAAHRQHLRDRAGRRYRALQAHDRLRRLLSDRHGRARPEDSGEGRGSWHYPAAAR